MNAISGSVAGKSKIAGLSNSADIRLLGRMNRRLADTLRRHAADDPAWRAELEASIAAKENLAAACERVADDMDGPRDPCRSLGQVLSAMWPPGHPLHGLIVA